MANAYATIADGRPGHELVHRREGRPASNGEVRYRAHPQGRPGASPRTSTATSTTPCSRSSRPAPARRRRRSAGRPPARPARRRCDRRRRSSAWFVGYTPQLARRSTSTRAPARPTSTGSAACSTFFGGDYPARIWTAFMTAAMQRPAGQGLPAAGARRQDVNPQPTFTPSPTTSSPTPTPTTTTPTPTVHADDTDPDDAVARSAEHAARPVHPAATDRHALARHRLTPVTRPGADRRSEVVAPTRDDASSASGARWWAARSAAGPAPAPVVDADARPAGAHLPRCGLGLVQQAALPDRRLGCAGRSTPTPATATSRRCTSRAGWPTARSRTSTRPRTSRSSTPC